MTNSRGKRKENKPVDEVMEVVEKAVDEKKTVKAETKTETVAPLNKKGVVNCHMLNVRKAPSRDAAVLQVIHKDTNVEVLEQVDDAWCRIRVGDIKNGFCMKEFISITK